MRGPLIGISLALVIGAAGAAAFYTTASRPSWPFGAPSAGEPRSAPPAVTAESTAPAPEASAAPDPTAPTGPRPSFDVVLVKPTGGVIAGRAAPGAEVTVEDNGAALGKATADRHGEWVVTPERPLAPGRHALELTARSPEAGEPARSDSPVTLVVPPAASKAPMEGSSAPPASLAAAIPAAGKAVHELTAGDAASKRTLTVDAVGYDAAGRVILSGRAEPGAELRLYLDDRFIGTKVAPDGTWSETLPSSLAPGVYRLRVDEVRGSDGKVLTRVALPLQRAAGAPPSGYEGMVVVQPGNSLWRIAKRSYGAGPRFVEIYGANRAQIADPNRIYPGQVFELPQR